MPQSGAAAAWDESDGAAAWGGARIARPDLIGPSPAGQSASLLRGAYGYRRSRFRLMRPGARPSHELYSRRPPSIEGGGRSDLTPPANTAAIACQTRPLRQFGGAWRPCAGHHRVPLGVICHVDLSTCLRGGRSELVPL